MVNWQDPALLLKDYFAFVKLCHAIAGVYIWETVMTVGFELDVLRGKRPYRWTIWIYLGTRYFGLLGFVLLLINIDSVRLNCQPIMVINWALGYVSLAFASLIVVLRVIAIWNRNIIVSVIAIGVWAGAVALNIHHVTELEGVYNPVLNSCIMLRTRRVLVNAIGVLVVDVVLFLTMLIGLLRHPHRSSTGMWKFLYQQCIIWITLAMIAEIPLVVFLVLDLNDPWNEMLTQPAAGILSVGSARMYRSLSERGFLTVTSDLPQYPGEKLIPPAPRGGATKYSGSFSQSEGTGTTCGAPVFLPANQIHVEFVPDMSTPYHPRENTRNKAAQIRYEIV